MPSGATALSTNSAAKHWRPSSLPRYCLRIGLRPHADGPAAQGMPDLSSVFVTSRSFPRNANHQDGPASSPDAAIPASKRLEPIVFATDAGRAGSPCLATRGSAAVSSLACLMCRPFTWIVAPPMRRQTKMQNVDGLRGNLKWQPACCCVSADVPGSLPWNRATQTSIRNGFGWPTARPEVSKPVLSLSKGASTLARASIPLNEQLWELAISVAYRWALDREIATKQLFVGKGALPRVHTACAQSGGDVTHTHQAKPDCAEIPPLRGVRGVSGRSKKPRSAPDPTPPCPPQGGNRGGCSLSLMRMGRNPALPSCHANAGLTSLSTNGSTAMRAPGQ
jgi:hypothetical protein